MEQSIACRNTLQVPSCKPKLPTAPAFPISTSISTWLTVTITISAACVEVVS